MQQQQRFHIRPSVRQRRREERENEEERVFVWVWVEREVFKVPLLLLPPLPPSSSPLLRLLSSAVAWGGGSRGRKLHQTGVSLCPPLLHSGIRPHSLRKSAFLMHPMSKLFPILIDNSWAFTHLLHSNKKGEFPASRLRREGSSSKKRRRGGGSLAGSSLHCMCPPSFPPFRPHRTDGRAGLFLPSTTPHFKAISALSPLRAFKQAWGPRVV